MVTIRRLILGVLLIGLPMAAIAGEGASERLAFQARGEPIDLVGDLAFPEGGVGRLPAMVVVHGSGGLGAREARWAAFLRQQGIATFTIDYFGPRGVTAKSPTQPTPVGDVTQAVARLAEHPRIDPSRIGVIGFSRGAMMSIAASNDGGRFTGGIRTAVHVALYPSCRRAILEATPTLPPVLILVGTEDSYTTPEDCRTLAAAGNGNGRVVDLVVYAGATHAWDSTFDGTFYHEAARKTVTIHPSTEITEQSRTAVLAFLKRFGME